MNYAQRHRLELDALARREEWILSTRGKDLPNNSVGGQEKSLRFRTCLRGHTVERTRSTHCPMCAARRKRLRRAQETL